MKHEHEHCSCGCDHGEHEHKPFSLSALLTLSGFAVFLGAHLPDKLAGLDTRPLYVAAYLLLAHDIIIRCFKNIARANFFDENFLMVFATVAAFVLGEYTEAAAVIMFFKIGDFFLRRTLRKSRAAINGLRQNAGESVFSEEDDKASRSEEFITKFAKVYTPAVIAAAVLIGIFAPLIEGVAFAETLHIPLAFILLACPCALVISIPLCYFAGLGMAGKTGAYLKGCGRLDDLSDPDKFKLLKIVPSSSDADTLKDADIVLTVPEETALPRLTALSRKVKRTVRGNIIFVLAVKLALMITNIFIELPLVLDVFGDAGLALLAILNGSRIYRGGGA